MLAFTRFGELPTEIRIQIWTEALPPPRVLELERVRGKWFGVPQSLPRPCSLLFVNQESRDQFLRVYDAVKLLIPSGSTSTIYYHNPAIDILYLSTIAPQPLYVQSGLQELAAISVFKKSTLFAINWSCLDTLQNLKQFPHLKEIYAITADPLWDRRAAGFVWKKVNGNIDIVEEDAQWCDGRDFRIDLMVAKCRESLRSDSNSHVRQLPFIRKKNILRGKVAMQGTGDW